MNPLLSPLRAIARVLRRGKPLDDCLVCGAAVRADEERMRVPGGGWVHRGCTTYRMRQNDRVRRRVRLGPA
jgi:hypothetical protein